MFGAAVRDYIPHSRRFQGTKPLKPSRTAFFFAAQKWIGKPNASEISVLYRLDPIFGSSRDLDGTVNGSGERYIAAKVAEINRLSVDPTRGRRGGTVADQQRRHARPFRDKALELRFPGIPSFGPSSVVTDAPRQASSSPLVASRTSGLSRIKARTTCERLLLLVGFGRAIGSVIRSSVFRPTRRFRRKSSGWAAGLSRAQLRCS